MSMREGGGARTSSGSEGGSKGEEAEEDEREGASFVFKSAKFSVKLEEKTSALLADLSVSKVASSPTVSEEK